ncbi:hypothetical protein [Salinarimonas soli]|uniref:Uncharacterized protein n=1 Tax=Salinarimonas soli TaxID=1638099 RepID=A0A5B2VD10_9HYPH|nr:hypothetical protein [Salinarimonas soli]KAA2236566.1 hypothetical protein F0L46_13905 [Salinarimonas soli]
MLYRAYFPGRTLPRRSSWTTPIPGDPTASVPVADCIELLTAIVANAEAVRVSLGAGPLTPAAAPLVQGLTSGALELAAALRDRRLTRSAAPCAIAAINEATLALLDLLDTTQATSQPVTVSVLSLAGNVERLMLIVRDAAF